MKLGTYNEGDNSNQDAKFRVVSFSISGDMTSQIFLFDSGTTDHDPTFTNPPEIG